MDECICDQPYNGLGRLHGKCRRCIQSKVSGWTPKPWLAKTCSWYQSEETFLGHGFQNNNQMKDNVQTNSIAVSKTLNPSTATTRITPKALPVVPAIKRDAHIRESCHLKRSSTIDMTKDPFYPPKIKLADWTAVKDAFFSKGGVFKTLSMKMNLAQQYYSELKKLVGGEGRDFAEVLASFWNGQVFGVEGHVTLNKQLIHLEQRLREHSFVPGREFSANHLVALKTLQKLGNDASHPSGIALKDKPKVIEAMFLLAHYLNLHSEQLSWPFRRESCPIAVKNQQRVLPNPMTTPTGGAGHGTNSFERDFKRMASAFQVAGFIVN